MAIREEIIIDVTDNGMAEATKQANALASATKKVSDTSKEMGKEMQGSSQSVLDNGGAMGLLNDATGGFAMTVKDAVEASVLFTKSQRLAAIQQKVMSFAVGTSTGAMKAFRLALIGTGIGAIVVALGLLIANFDKVKKAVLNLVPGLGVIADGIGRLVETVTDFIGVTSDASRALDKMVADSEASLKRNEHFLEANGDKFDEYTQRKIKANIDYNKKVKELAEDESLTEEEKIKRLKDFRDKADREILQADKDRQDKLQKARDEEAQKIKEQNQKIADERKKRLEEQRKLEEEEIKRREEENKRVNETLSANEQNKIDIEVQKQLEKEAILKSLREQTAEERLEEERQNALRTLELAEATQEEFAAVNAHFIEKQQELEDNAREAKRLKDEQDAEEQKARDKAVAEAKLATIESSVSNISAILKEGSEAAKGVNVAQAIMNTYQGVNSALAATIPFPEPAATAIRFANAAAVGIAGFNNVKKILATKPIEKGAPGVGATGNAPAAPSFNLVQGTGANQIAQSISTQQQPVQAFVVSSNVTSAQSMDRNIVENSTL